MNIRRLWSLSLLSGGGGWKPQTLDPECDAEAMGTSSALGAVVRAWDVRDVSDQAPPKESEG